MSKIRTILLVCTGNSCRSVMAGALLQKKLKGKGNYKIITAGVAAIQGMRPTDEVVQVMANEDIDVSGHRSSPLNDKLINEADLILVMEKMHREDILRRMPSAKGKIYLLTEFGRMKAEEKLVQPDIPDPIGKSLDFYGQVYAIIKESIERTVKKLEAG